MNAFPNTACVNAFERLVATPTSCFTGIYEAKNIVLGNYNLYSSLIL